MYKLTIVFALIIGTMVFAQPGKGKGNKGNADGGNHNQNNAKSTHFDNGGKGNQKHQPNIHISNQKQHGNKGAKGSQGGHGNGNKGSKDAFGHGKPSKQFGKAIKGNGGKSHKMSQPRKSYKGNGHSGKGPKMHYDKGHPNFGYVYVNKHGYFSHRNYGQWRSQQARNKHKKYHPVYEYQAVEGFNLIIIRNNFLFTETNYKINLIRTRLADRRRAGLIAIAEHDRILSRIALLERRRASLQINISL